MAERLIRANQCDVTLLHVEDDELDIIGFRRALGALGIANPVRNAHDGVEALEILRGEGGREPLASPFIVLLDLNMPKMDGLSFLEELRSDPRLRSAVVFVLTTSKADEDKCRAYQSNIAGYIVKQDAQDGFLAALELLKTYWQVVDLPAMA